MYLNVGPAPWVVGFFLFLNTLFSLFLVWRFFGSFIVGSWYTETWVLELGLYLTASLKTICA